MKKILAATSIRSDYDLMSELYLKLHADTQIELKLLVSGAHLADAFGSSGSLIEQDGLDILLRIESLINSNSKSSRIKSAAIYMLSAIDAVAQYDPDLMLYAGDREDALVSAMIGGYLGIPTVHFFGGDHVADGHIDNPVRHAVSKLSTIHMVSLEQHRQRLLLMGEHPERIFNIGSIALDRFVRHVAMSKSELRQALNIEAGFEDFALMIFHPLKESGENAGEAFETVLKSLKGRGICTFVSAPNTDPGNQEIFDVIERYRTESCFYFYKNLPRDLFLSIYKHSQFLIGNSSSGILEAASVPIPAINVGLRQVGRFADPNVVFCGVSQDEIEAAIDLACSPVFLQTLSGLNNSYGRGDSVRRALALIKTEDFKSSLLKKEDILNLREL